MNDIKIMLHDILYKDNKVDMNKLGDMFIDIVYGLKDKDPMKFKSIKYDMHIMAYGEHLTENEAKCWVYSMKNKDGSKGEHWTYEQTESIRAQYSINHDACDFYAVLNMVYSDYYSQSFDINKYVELAKDWLDDEDVPAGKTLKYYLFVVC